MAKPDIEIIFENEHLLAVNKPSGMLTIPDRFSESLPSLSKTLEKKYGKIFIVHRLDRETSGLLLFAKDETSHKYLSQLFENRGIEKFYLGIVQGSLPNGKGVMDEPIMEHPAKKGLMMVNRKGKASVTNYEVLKEYGLCSLVKYQIQTGRTHQIRVHMKHLGHPILCDDLYGSSIPVLLSSFKKKFNLSKNEEEERPLLARLALHSHQLNFTGPGGENHRLVADLPADMNVLLKQLNKYKA